MANHPLVTSFNFKLIILVFISLFLETDVRAQSNKYQVTHEQYIPYSQGKNSGRVHYRVKYDVFMGEPVVTIVAKVVEFDGCKPNMINIECQIYQGQTRVGTDYFKNVQSVDVAGSPSWDNLWEGPYDGERTKQIFKEGFYVLKAELKNLTFENCSSNKTDSNSKSSSSKSSSPTKETVQDSVQTESNRTSESGAGDEQAKKTEQPAPMVYDPEKGKLLSSDMQDFVGKLASETNNPDIKKLSNDLNNINQAFDDIYGFDAMWGKADASDMEAYNQVESVAQAIALGVFIYNLAQKNEPQYTPEQEQAREALRNMLRNVRTLYDEVKYVPHIYQFNEEALTILDKRENLIRQYEHATSAERALYFSYLYSSPAFSISQLKTKYAELKKKSSIELIAICETYQQKTSNLQEMKHMTNTDYAFKDELFKIQYNRAKCYDALGESSKANEIRARLNYEEANANVVVSGIQDGILQNNNQMAIQSFEVLKRYMVNKGVWNKYDEFESLKIQGAKGLLLSDAMYLLSLGAIAYTRDRQYDQAQSEIDFIRDFNQRTYEWYLREKDKKVKKYEQLSHDGFVQDLLNAYHNGKVYEKAARAYLYSVLNKEDGGLKLIEEAINYELPASINNYLKIDAESNLHYIKFKVLINKGMYEEAIETSRLVREGCLIASKDQVRFEKVSLNYKRERYDLAKTGLDILISKNGEQPRYLLLYSDVLNKLGQDVESKKYYRKYEQKLRTQ